MYLAGFCLILTEQTGLDSKYTLYEKNGGQGGRELSELNIIHDHGNLNFFFLPFGGQTCLYLGSIENWGLGHHWDSAFHLKRK